VRAPAARGSGRRPPRIPLIAGVAGLAVVIAAATTALWTKDGGGRPNLLLVSIDTLRADHLGCYGYRVPTSPNLDAFAARRGILFETAVAAAPSTTPSHASMLTSLLPSHHGALFSRQAPLAPEILTLAEILSAEGYRTFSVNDGGQMDAVWGLSQGFDEYLTLPGRAQLARFRRTVDRATRWLDEAPRDGRPWFAFLHTYETHHPYSPDPSLYEAIGHEYRGPLPSTIDKPLLSRINGGDLEIGDADRAHIVAAYDAEIRSMDEAFGALVAVLEERGLMDDTVVVVTSDHGEELGERGMMGWHSHALWDEQLLVPLIVRLPGERFAGARIGAQVRGIDVMPTALDLLGIAPPPSAEGRTVMPLVIEAPDAPRPAVSQRDVREDPLPASLRAGGRKLHRRGGDEPLLLFDLAADPGEARDLAEEAKDEAARAGARLDALIGARPAAPASQPVAFDAQLLGQLGALGSTADRDAAPAQDEP